MIVGAKYALFCVLAILANLTAQRSVLSIGLQESYIMAVGAGTAVGLICKFYLDKNFIFQHHTSTRRSEPKTFMLYSFTGVFTTFIFWISETTLYVVYGTDFAREVGAVIGLTIGYILKYRLDKRYVF